jgi:endonuclease YncB( thermonuclease family)
MCSVAQNTRRHLPFEFVSVKRGPFASTFVVLIAQLTTVPPAAEKKVAGQSVMVQAVAGDTLTFGRGPRRE